MLLISTNNLQAYRSICMSNKKFCATKWLRTFNAPVEKVWNAITNREQMKQWYFDIADFKPEVGFEFQFTGKSDAKKQVHLCKITEVILGKKCSYSWRHQGYEDISFVTFEFFAEGAATRLKLTHEGLKTFPQNNPEFRKECFAAGWTELIETLLKAFVEKQPVEQLVLKITATGCSEATCGFEKVSCRPNHQLQTTET